MEAWWGNGGWGGRLGGGKQKLPGGFQTEQGHEQGRFSCGSLQRPGNQPQDGGGGGGTVLAGGTGTSLAPPPFGPW